MEMNFCRRCATPLTQKSAGVYICQNQHTLYTNGVPAAGIFFLTEDNNILLSVRGIEPFKGMLDSFGGFVEDGETVEEALSRELKEELGLSPEHYDPPQFLCTEVSGYPYDGETRGILSIFFWSRLKPGATPIPADDVAEIVQVPLADVDFSQLDNADVQNAVKKLQKIIL